MGENNVFYVTTFLELKVIGKLKVDDSYFYSGKTLGN